MVSGCHGRVSSAVASSLIRALDSMRRHAGTFVCTWMQEMCVRARVLCVCVCCVCVFCVVCCVCVCVCVCHIQLSSTILTDYFF